MTQQPAASRSFRSDVSVRPSLQPIRYQQYTPTEPPPGMSYAAFLRSWSDEHVAKWLNDIKCGCHEDTFKANEIRGQVLLDLDQNILLEMGIASIGDRLRILNAIKILRQTVSTKPPSSSSIDLDSKDGQNNRTSNRRLENVRPAPLQLNAHAGRADLPAIQRDPDSARSSQQQHQPPPPPPPIRPLPMPQQSTPISAHSSSSGIRANLPPPPPPPRGQPPLPPGAGRVNRSYTNSPAPDPPSYTSQTPLPPPPSSSSGLHTPSSGSWINQHLPADPRPGNPGSRPISGSTNRAISPLPPARLRPNQIGGVQSVHGRTGSFGGAAGSPKRPLGNTYPSAGGQSTPHHPASNLSSTLSPIDEAFSTNQSTGSNTPSPQTNIYSVGRGPFNHPSSSSNVQSSLNDLRRRLVKFIIPDGGLSFTIDVASCNGGVEVVEKVLKKFTKNNLKTDSYQDVSQTEEGGLSVDGWGVFMDLGQGDSPGRPLSEAELLSICHAPDHPTREYGLVLRRLPLSNVTNRSTKRASSISILSGLGVRDPERALDASSIISSGSSSAGQLSPPSHNLSSSSSSSFKRPSKLRNFFGQRPPSELITNHLTEFFPNAEKKVLQRTARNSMMRKRDSVASYRQTSRFSTSTEGSRLSQPPPVPDKGDIMDILPRVSLSTHDGRSVDLHLDSRTGSPKDPIPQLPHIPFPSIPLSESMDNNFPSDVSKKRMSRAISTSSKRMSFMTELRSKRDNSDTASLMTVDQITEAVENRRASGTYRREEELDGWTKVDSEIEDMVPQAVADDGVEDEDVESEISEDEEDETLHDEEEEELSLDVDDDGVIRNVLSAKRANKWIKGALIGAGSFGKVYLGMDASSGLLMAVKQVELPTGSAPNQERKKSMLTALEREIELLKNLHHENIVQYLYSSIDDEYLNIFLEYVPGGSVTTLLRNYGAFEEPLVRNWVRQILQGLNYLHERDIIHRDIKGANILVDNKGGVKISDFGISKKVDDTLLTGNRMNRPSLQGSVFWMAPEVVKQTRHTHKADIWSIGCLVVEMLTGEHPWAQLTQMQAIFQIGSSATPTIPSDISPDAQDFLKQTFKIDHEARPSAVELVQHLWIATLKSV